MQSSPATIIALIAVIVGVTIIPLVTLADRNDNVVQENVKLIVNEFVTDIKNTGKLTAAKYQDFESKLAATGNSYEIEMEIQHLDENPGKKLTQANYTKIGENVYYSEYTTQILNGLENNPKLLKEGDIVYVQVKNENTTTAQDLKGSFLNFSNEGEQIIEANSSGMVLTNGI